MGNLAHAYSDAGRLADALPLHEETRKRLEAQFGPDHLHTLTALNNLANAYRDARRHAEALPLFEQTLNGLRKTIGLKHPTTLLAMNNLALAYRDCGRVADAIPLHEQALKSSNAQLGPDHPDTLFAMRCLAEDYLDVKPAAAEPILRQVLAIREKKLPDDWATFETQSSLGASLLGQKRYAEAEPLLIEGFEAMKVRETKIPPASKARLTKAGERIVQLYEAWGKKEKAEEWRKRLAQPADATKPKP